MKVKTHEVRYYFDWKKRRVICSIFGEPSAEYMKLMRVKSAVLNEKFYRMEKENDVSVGYFLNKKFVEYKSLESFLIDAKTLNLLK